MPSIPRGISQDEISQVLARVDRDTSVGRRDYAILLLLSRLGLRSSEIVKLSLDDINWESATFSVGGKGCGRREYPVPEDVGDAISIYLRFDRPKVGTRRLFLCSKAPRRGLSGAGTIGSIVRSAIVRAGVTPPTYGAHQFRHGLATEMLRQGASLAEIGDVLGHRHPQTTKIYTKVDVAALRSLAIPWPAGA